MVVGLAVNQEGSVQLMLPIPEPAPVKVQVVPTQDTAVPLKVYAPAVPLILVTPADDTQVPSDFRYPLQDPDAHRAVMSVYRGVRQPLFPEFPTAMVLAPG